MKDENSEGMGRIMALLDQLHGIYEEYMSEIERYNREKSEDRNLMKSLFSGRAEFASLPAHKTFFQKADECTSEMCRMLGDMRARGEAERCSEISEKAVRFMICEDKAPLQKRESFSYCAAETYSECLLQFLSDDARRRIYSEYRKRFKPMLLLPNQKRIMKTLSSG